ncbi:T-Complex Protein 11 X-Linked Protein 2 [Manis pentadactyla]|nr:T-Complex Protein 11 X-Linked Protein 2 [Manis pentadactyla]
MLRLLYECNVLFSSYEFVDKLKCITKALTEEFNCRSEEAVLSVSEQVSQEIHQGLRDRGFTALSSENAASLTGQLQNITKKDNCVHSIIGKSPPQVVVARVVKNREDELGDTALEVSSQTT